MADFKTLSIQSALSKIGAVAQQKFGQAINTINPYGDTNPKQAGNQNFWTTQAAPKVQSFVNPIVKNYVSPAIKNLGSGVRSFEKQAYNTPILQLPKPGIGFQPIPNSPKVKDILNIALPDIKNSPFGQLAQGNFNQVIPAINKNARQILDDQYLIAKKNKTPEENQRAQFAMSNIVGNINTGGVKVSSKELGNIYNQFNHALSASLGQAGKQYSRQELDSFVSSIVNKNIKPHLIQDEFLRQAVQLANFINVSKKGLIANAPSVGLGIQNIRKASPDELHTLSRGGAMPAKVLNFAETSKISQSLYNALRGASNAQDEVTILKQFTENAIKTSKGNSLKATRAALNKEIDAVVGNNGSFAKNFAMRKKLLDSPIIGPRLNALEDGIAKIDEALKQPVQKALTTLYHGSSTPGRNVVRMGDGNLGKGVYLTNSVGDARNYAAGWAGGVDPSEFEAITPQHIKSVQLITNKIFKSPMDLNSQQVAAIKLKGFDGVQTPHETIVFDPKNIKVIGNPTTEEFAKTGLAPIQKSSRLNPVEDKLNNLPPLRPSGRRGFTNVREIDNPLLARGQQRTEGYAKGNPQQPGNPLENIVIKSGTDVNKKVGILDYLRTPDRVLEKIGLGNQAKLLRKKYEDYQRELPTQIETITEWSKRVPGSAQTIFRYLDGQGQKLNPEEMKVAQEIKGYMSAWADRLKLPKDNRITNYITHIFEKDFINKEFDEDLARIIRDKVPGSTYDPFVQKRLGKQGYIEDVWQALDAYVKRATRKVHMDEALSKVKEASEGLETSQYNYVKQYIDRVNMRPTDLDNLLDNSIKQMVGYKFGQRPTAYLSRIARQWVYRATLGLNPGSAIRNLSQGANTYAKLGEKYTIIGYTKFLKEALSGSDELQRVGVLQDDIIQDRTVNATRQFMQKLDKGLFVFFDGAEKINRGSAYYGAKAKALSQGMNEAQAIEYGKKIVRDTQFVFGSIDTPAALQNDIVKTLTQFQSFTLKQVEFLGEMLKNKDLPGILRYSAASLTFVFTIGKLIGMKPEQIIPMFRFDTPPTLQLPIEIGKAAIDAPDDYGSPQDATDKAINITKAAGLFIPGFTQGMKTYQGIESVNRGYDESRKGRVKFPINQTPGNYIRAGLFGKYNLPEARDYRDNQRSTLGEQQSEEFRQSPDRFLTYKEITQSREDKAKDEVNKEALRSTEDLFKQENNKFYIKQRDGDIKTIDLNAEIPRPQMTGSPLIDTRGMELYRDSLGKRINEIYDLAAIDALPEQAATNEINRILVEQNKVRQSLSRRYVKPRTLADVIKSQEQADINSQAAEAYKRLQDGSMTINEATTQLSTLKIQAKALSKPRISRGRKIKVKKYKVYKPKKLKFKKVKLSKLKIKKPKGIKKVALLKSKPIPNLATA